MAEWLDRPMLIDVRLAPFVAPTLALDGEVEAEPSPFEGTFQQYKLIQSISTNHGRLGVMRETEEIDDVQQRVSHWQKELPPYFYGKEADRSWDCKCPWLPLQRALIQCYSEMVKFTPLKPILTSFPEIVNADSQRLRELAVETGIRCISTATRLHNVLSSIKLSFHFVVFALFDTATVLCSAVLHDKA